MIKHHWQSDERVTHCGTCNVLFTSAIRKHHCRVCGDIFCDRCSKKKITVEALNVTDERCCERCFDWHTLHLPFLLQERNFVRYESGGSYSVAISLSRDEKSLKINYVDFEKKDRALPTSQVTGVEDGQRTRTWQSHTQGMCACFGSKVAGLEDQCFSVVFSSETVDLYSESSVLKAKALDAFRALASWRQSRHAQVLDEARASKVVEEQNMKQREADERQKLISSKYSGMRDEMTKKYGTGGAGGGKGPNRV